MKDAKWVRNPIDAFILARLEKEGLQPVARGVEGEAHPAGHARPDRPAADAGGGGRVRRRHVDRRLREARRPAARLARSTASGWSSTGSTPSRYADTNGYQGDPTRTNWPWRDWVVEAMNANMPFDQFVTEQLAGDLLPNATPKQRLATAFNRNHTFNGEGGRIPDETRVENVMDRTETVGTVFLGLTIGCTRCHDHKFDPITQAEYFQLYAYFNNSRRRPASSSTSTAATCRR